MTAPRLALVTCSLFPDLHPQDQLLREALTVRSAVAEGCLWDDPSVDWASYDLVVLRSPWDYSGRRDEFVSWAESVPRLANPAAVVRWNTDKRYLRSLAELGVPVVPTSWLEPGDAVVLPENGEFVVKPAISAGASDTGRYDAGDPAHLPLARDLAGRLLAAGRTVMVQPYMADIDTAGETALLFLGGEFSHAVRKGPILAGPFLEGTSVRPGEDIAPRSPSDLECAVADQVLAAARECVPSASETTYARVDLVPGPDGTPLLLELELTEPYLFLEDAPGATDRLADVLMRTVRTAAR
ncbi:MAG: hypothetical protein JWN54_3394 [Mycobacterium sp.]|nr:hypothetical protein [Mycobacterium sp.]